MRQTVPGRPDLSGDSMLPDVFAKPGEPFAERDVYIDMPPGPNNGMRHALLHGAAVVVAGPLPASIGTVEFVLAR
jgi:hypothetical protein